MEWLGDSISVLLWSLAKIQWRNRDTLTGSGISQNLGAGCGMDIRDSNDRSSGCGIVVTKRAEMRDLDSPFQAFPTLKRCTNLLFSLRGGRKKRRGGGEGEKYQRETVEGVPYPLPLAPSLFSPFQSPTPFDACYAGYSLSAQLTTAKSFVSLSNLWEVSGLV